MGSLAGHVLPGTFFLIYGFWWVVISLWTHLSSKGTQKSKREGSSSSVTSFLEYRREHGLSRKSWLPQIFCPRVPLEPVLKIVLPLCGIIAEAFFDVVNEGHGPHIKAKVFRVFDDDGHLAGLGKLHHVTMYGAFALSGIVDIISLFIRVPRHTSQLFLSLAFWVEGILFYFHTHGRDPLNVQIHWILTVLIFLCATFSLLRMIQPTNLLINMGLGNSILLQGTWFIQAGHILFRWSKTDWFTHVSDSPEGDGDNHEAIMLVSACFTWHLIGISLLLVLLWVVFHLMLRSGIRLKLSRRRQRARGPPTWVDADREEQERLIIAGLESAPKDSQTATMELQDVAETAT